MKTFTPSVEADGIIAHRQPGFTDQVTDDTRQGLVRSMAEARYGLGSDISISGNVPKVYAYTEQEALAQTMLLLEEAMTNPKIPEDLAVRAADIYENLSFIGEKELTEATRAIAEYWKMYLSNNPDSLIFVVTSKTFESESMESGDDVIEEIDLGHVSNNKSDDYIVDKVLSNFNDEELQKYGNRLLFSAAELTEQESRAIKTIVLDDWIMSGQQMQDTLDKVFEHMTPADLEINLVACNESRLAKGIIHSQVANPIPVKACFISHNANHSYASEFGGAYLTAAHSSGDYPFEGTLEEIVTALNKVRVHEKAVYMPPLTNIVRPYYLPDYRFRHAERLSSIRDMGRSALLSS
jgi:hypothetical protein